MNSLLGGRVLEHESKTIFNEGLNKGLNIGLNIGRDEGWNEAKQDTALRMYKKGIKAEDIANMMDASITLVKQWLNTPVPAANNA